MSTNAPPLRGFIFVKGSNALPPAYRTFWQGEEGFFAKVTQTHYTGHFPVKAARYAQIVKAYELYCFHYSAYERLKESRECVNEDIAHATAHNDDKGLQTLFDIALKYDAEMLWAAAHQARAQAAFHRLIREPETDEEIAARDQELVDAVAQMNALRPIRSGRRVKEYPAFH